MKYEFTAKKFIILLVAIIVLFIPTYIGIAYYYNSSKPETEITENTYLHVKDPKGTEYEFHQDADFTRWSMFDSMIKNAQSCAGIPDSVNMNDNMVLVTYITVVNTTSGEEGTTVQSSGTEKQYAFYFSTDKSNCYFMDPGKKVFKITEADVITFLSDETLSSFLYKAAEIPTATVLGKPITPATLEWYYLAAGNNYHQRIESSSNYLTFENESGTSFPVEFSIQPTKCVISITDQSGNSLYEKSYTEAPVISIKDNTLLKFEVTAEWTKDTTPDYYGKETFIFYSDMTAEADFIINTEEIHQGDFAIISAKNIKDTSKITFTSTPALPYNPVFYKSGNTATALIPVSYGCTQGQYTIAVSYGTVSETFTLNVTDYRHGFSDNNKITTFDTTNYTTENLSVYDKLVAEICSATSSDTLSGGKFLDYAKNPLFNGGSSTLKIGFARNVIINKDSSKVFLHTGLDYGVTVASSAIPAMFGGKVVYTGNDNILGNFVVLDHGCGLRTWYAHLDNITAVVGTTVNAGDSLGDISKNGSTGFTVKGFVHIGATVGNQPVAIYGLTENGIILPTFAD